MDGSNPVDGKMSGCENVIGTENMCKKLNVTVENSCVPAGKNLLQTTSKRHLVFRPDLLPDVFANDV